jgi:hypothetical protein
MKSKEINRSLLGNYTSVIQSLDKSLTLNTTASNIDNNKNKTNSNIDLTTADWKTYENKQYNFSLKYPSTWNIKDSSIPFFSELGLKISAPYDPTAPNPTEYVTLDVLKETGSSLDSFSKSVIDGMKYTTINFKLLKNEDVYINDIPSKKMEYTQYVPFFNMVKLNYLIKVGDNLFTFTFGEDMQTYTKYLDKIESIIKTFKIT